MLGQGGDASRFSLTTSGHILKYEPQERQAALERAKHGRDTERLIVQVHLMDLVT